MEFVLHLIANGYYRLVHQWYDTTQLKLKWFKKQILFVFLLYMKMGPPRHVDTQALIAKILVRHSLLYFRKECPEMFLNSLVNFAVNEPNVWKSLNNQYYLDGIQRSKYACLNNSAKDCTCGPNCGLHLIIETL
eukprot:239098_1